MNKTLLLGFHHGNERLGEYLIEHIRAVQPDLLPYVDYAVANPRAKKFGVRFIESDMNRSYNNKNLTYEECRAIQLLGEITAKDYSIVLDLHTTTCVQPPCFIVADTAANSDFLRASSITKIVEMNHAIVQTSLIGNYTRAVSIEINEAEAKEPRTLASLCRDIRRFQRSEIHGQPKEFYEVTSLLKKSEITPNEAEVLQNFTRSPRGFYPVLVGENSYKKQTDYLGFKASTRHIRKI